MLVLFADRIFKTTMFCIVLSVVVAMHYRVLQKECIPQKSKSKIIRAVTHNE